MVRLILKWLKSYSIAKTERDLMRLAQTEYKKDWEYAYHVLLQGKSPDLH